MPMSLRSWLDGAVERTLRGDGSFESAHVDEVGLECRSVEDVVRLLDVAASFLPTSWAGRLSLALPLDESPRLTTRVPRSSESAWSEIEPPSFYLMSAEHFVNQVIDGEEYRTRTEIATLPPHLAAEFVSYRDFAARDLDWGYVNTLWIHRLRPPDSNG